MCYADYFSFCFSEVHLPAAANLMIVNENDGIVIEKTFLSVKDDEDAAVQLVKFSLKKSFSLLKPLNAYPELSQIKKEKGEYLKA